MSLRVVIDIVLELLENVPGYGYSQGVPPSIDALLHVGLGYAKARSC